MNACFTIDPCSVLVEHILEVAIWVGGLSLRAVVDDVSDRAAGDCDKLSADKSDRLASPVSESHLIVAAVAKFAP